MDDYPGLVSATLFSLAILVNGYAQKCQKPTLFAGTDRNRRLLARCPSLKETFYPSPLFWNNHIQLLHFSMFGGKKRVAPHKWSREIVTLPDGQDIALDWKFPNQADVLKPSTTDDTPILVLNPGSSCDSTDIPGQDYVIPALQRGWSVVVFNRRGHMLPLTRPKCNFFGCCDDLHFVTQHILSVRPRARLVTIGISAGSGLVARHFGKDCNDFVAGVSLCPGYNIEKCMGRVGYPYQDIMIASVKEYFMRGNEALFRDTPGYRECSDATCFQEWLDHCYGMAGYASREEYYLHSNPMNYVHEIPAHKPCLAINAADDPICVMENVQEYVDMLQSTQGGASLVVSASGSHCPFYEGWAHANWAEKVCFEFLDAVLSEDKQ